MSGHSYEVALFGEFFAKDLTGTRFSLQIGDCDVQLILLIMLCVAILNRITLHSESAQRMHSKEIVFEPYDAQWQRDNGNEPVLLRAKKELLETDPKW